MNDVAGMRSDIQTARQEMLEQRQEMKDIGFVADGVLGHVETLSADFKKIDAAQQKAEKRWTDLVSDVNVKSAPEHV